MKKRLCLRRKYVALAILVCAFLMPVSVVLLLWLSLPSVDSLHDRSQPKSTTIHDRNGFILYVLNDPRVGHHTPIPLESIPLHLRQATVAVEDATFYSNPGVDIGGILRALWINVQGGEVLAGGSTITQQLARTLLLDPEERAQRSLIRKIRESLLAWQIAQRYSKDNVLGLYLNEIYFGNLAYGVDSAAKAYFGKSVTELDLAESALLAGLPQSPVSYDPFVDPDAAKKRQQTVLDLMVKQGVLDSADANIARQARLSYAPQRTAIRAPHFVAYVRHWLEDKFGSDAIVREGLRVTTTLDLALNDNAQAIVRERVSQLQEASAQSPSHDARNAALVAVKPGSGEIVAMVGSPDYFDAEISGAVNATLSLRQPGSAIKPITYAAAFIDVEGFTAATPIYDIRTAFPTREGTPYIPENYDRQNYGPISVRTALATSNNVAAVQVLQQVGIDSMLSLANAMGIHSFKRADHYGLALTLGGGEVRLLELTTAFGVFANSGHSVTPFAVLEVTDGNGNVLYKAPQASRTEPVIDPRIAWLISDILSDNAARASAFGQNSVLQINRPAAVKTGTTTDWRDNWTVGYTPDLVTGVWVGNANNDPMVRISGVTGAGPIWHDFMEVAHRAIPVRQFQRPTGLREVKVCELSGLLPTAECAFTRNEWFVEGTEPSTYDDWYVVQGFDTGTGVPASASTPLHRIEQRIVLRLPLALRDWAKQHGWHLYEENHALETTCEVGADDKCAAPIILQPDNGSIYRVSAQLPVHLQRIQVSVRIDDPEIKYAELVLDDQDVVARFDTPTYMGFWIMQPGTHTFVVRAYYADGRVVSSAITRIQVAEK